MLQGQATEGCRRSGEGVISILYRLDAFGVHEYTKTRRQDGSELGRRGSAGRRTSGQDEAAMTAAARRTGFGDWRFSKTKY